MQDSKERVAYAYATGSTLGIAVWALVVVAEVLASVSLLRSYPSAHELPPVCLTIVCLTFLGGLLSLLLFCEISIEAEILCWHKRSWLDAILKKPAVERRIPSRSIVKFRLDKGPWDGPRLMIMLDDGSCISVPKGSSSTDAKNDFEVFLASFRLFARNDPNHTIEEAENVWWSSVRRAWVGVIVVACIPVGFFAYRASMERRDLIIVVVGVALFAMQGVRFLAKREQPTGR